MKHGLSLKAQDPRHKWWIFSVAATGVLLSTIDASIVNIALPTISSDFNTSVQATAWVTISYLLVITALLLVFGRLSDIFGQKLIFASGLAVFTVGSGLCAISGGITALIVFRLIQGIGASMIISNTSAIVTNAFPPAERGKGLGTIGAVVSVGLMSGPPLGGIIIHYLGWHYIFLVNVPVGILAVIFTLKILPEHKADKGARIFHPLDSILWVAGITSLVAAFGASNNSDAVFLKLAPFLVLSLCLMGFFFYRQVNSSSPLFNPRLLKNGVFLLASIAGFFSYMTMISLTFMLPFLLEHTYHYNPFNTGLILMTIPAMTAFVSPLSGILSDKFGQRPIASLGTFLITVAISLLLFIGPDTPLWRIIANLALFGIGLGMFGSPNNSALMGSVDNKDRGSAGGILATVRNLGMVTGMGIISIIYSSGIRHFSAAESAGYAAAFNAALPVVIAFSLVALVFSALRRSVA